ncbi:hypothetical protein GIX45_00705 [Erwinia sp. CPCC 100877]|nr:hypothetical protein [Erwinia sp. CPCC 100877]
MSAYRKQEWPDFGGSKKAWRRQTRDKMERMGLAPEQRRFIEGMLGDETDGEQQDEVSPE